MGFEGGGAQDREELRKVAREGVLWQSQRGLKSAIAKAIERDVFRAPAFFVGGEMFWGNDRLQFVEAALKG